MSELEKIAVKDQLMYPDYQGNDYNSQLVAEEKAQRDEAAKRQSELSKMINNEKSYKTATAEEMNIWQAARIPNAFNVRTQQALKPFMELQEKDNVTFFDIEAIGTPAHLRQKGGFDLFAMTELSFGGTQFNGKDFVRNNTPIISMAVAPSDHEYNRFKRHIEDLKKNPLMGISQDLHRSILDLTKYSDIKKITEGDYFGHKFASINDHARVPTALTALTTETLRQAELGLNNLYSKGTKIEDAFSIFQNYVQKTNSKLGGYNIHHYDLPAILGIANNKGTKEFLANEAKKALDFYHGYSAVTEDPFTLTGASLRQEHIHQSLLSKNIIKGKLDANGQPKKYLYHLAANDIQANMEIGGFTTNKILSYIKNVKDVKPKFALSPKQLKTSILEEGATLFSYQSGFFDNTKHKYNLVGRQDDNQIKPRWENLNTPLPSNERFTVNKFFRDVQLPNSKQKGFGVHLDSKDIPGKSVMLFSETLEELQQQIHGSFLPLNDEQSAGFRKIKATYDQPYEEYKKMFEGNGWNKMVRNYNLLTTKANDVSWSEHILNNKGSEELAMKFPHLVSRLEGEKEVWAPVIEQLKNSNLTDEQKTMVLRQVKSNLDDLGDNRKEVTSEGSKFFTFNFSKDDQFVMNGKDSSQIKNAFRSYIKGRRQNERLGEPEASYKVARINELSNFIIDQFHFGEGSKQTQMVKNITTGMVNEVYNGGKIETALTSLSNMVREQVELKGKSSFVREVTNSMTEQRVGAVQKLSKNISSVLSKSVVNARAIKNGKDAFSRNSKLANFANQQDQRIQELFKRNFKLGNNMNTVERAGKSAAKYSELLKGIVNSYKTEFNTQVLFREDGTPYLVLGDKKSGINARDIKSYKELVRNPKMSVVQLPYMDENLMVRWGTERKVPMIRSGMRDGSLYHGTSVTDALGMIRQQSQKILTTKLKGDAKITSNPFGQIESTLKRVISRKVSPVAGDASGMLSREENKMFSVNSAIASRSRSAMWDISGYAEGWYRENAVRLGFASTSAEANAQANKIAARAKNKYSTFAEEMGLKAKSLAMGGSLHEFASDKSGLRGSIHGLNNAAASRLLVGTTPTDSRRYIALGNLMGDSGENPLKTVNYRKLDPNAAVSTLTKAGQMADYRLNHSFVSDEAHNLLTAGDGEWRGLALKTGFITDTEIAAKLKDADTVSKYKKQIDKAKSDGRITDTQARQMKRTLDNGMLSTSEGLSVIDAELLSAYDGWDEVRVKAEGDIKLHPKIEGAIQQEAIKQGLAVDTNDKTWKKTGITFDKPVELDLSDLYKDNKLTLGSYTVNSVTSKIEEEKRLRPDKRVALMGYNVDDPFKTGLVLGRERTSGQGTKIITESGYRGTVTPMLKEIISDIYDVEGTEFLREHLPEKKSATSLMDYIRGIDMDIRQQFDGTVTSNHIKGSFKTVDEALNAFYKDVEGIGIPTQVVGNGLRTVSSDFGYGKAGLNEGTIVSRKGFENLASNWNSKLGHERTTAASIVMAHNVDTNYFGATNSAKITTKEIDMVNRGFQLAGITKPGELSNYTNFLIDQVIGKNTSPEVKMQQKVFGDIVQAIGKRDAKMGWVPQAGDSVIDFTSEGNDVLSGTNAELKNGVLHVSKDTFEPVPTNSAKGQVLTIADYNRTIVNAGKMQIQLEGAKNTVSLSQKLRETNGTAFLKLPDAFKQQYIPLIDTESMALPGEGFKDQRKFLNQIQGKYASIGRDMDEYNSLYTNNKLTSDDVVKVRGDLIERINRNVSDVSDILSGYTSNEGSQQFLSRRLENSTRLGTTGVNPVLAYKKENGKWVNRTFLEESHIYMNEHDVRNQINGIEEQIAKSWGIDTSKIEGNVSDYVINNFNKHDTFALTNRNPSINSSTLQVAKVKIDNSVGKGMAASLRGMGERIKQDYDGDQQGVLFTHYAEKDNKTFNAIMGDMKEVYKSEYGRNMTRANNMMNDIEGSFRTNLAAAMNEVTTGGKFTAEHPQIANIAEQFFAEGLSGKDLTLGNLHGNQVQDVVMQSLRKSHTDAYVKNPDYWGMSKNGDTALGRLENEKTLLARASGNSIGSADMIRMKMQAAFMANAETKYKHFNEAEGPLRYTQKDFIRETSTVNEFLREFSQKAISTKHTGTQSDSNAVESMLSNMFDVMDRVRNVRDSDDLDGLAKSIVNRGMFKEAPMLEIGGGQRYAGSNVDFVKDALGILQDSEKLYQNIGMNGSKDPSLLIGASQGAGEKYLTQMIQSGEHIPTLSNQYLSVIAQEHEQTKMSEFDKLREAAVVRQHQQKFANIEDRLNDAGSTSEIINNSMKTKPLVNANGEMAVHRTIRDHVDDTVSEIATMAKHSFSGSASSALGVMGLGLGAFVATNALAKNAPTPEGLQEMAPVSPEVLGAPTARVTPKQNGEYINIQINAKAAQKMNHQDLAAMINNEVMSMSNVRMKTDISVNDNSNKIDSKWMDNAVANAMDKGYAY